MSTSSAKSPMTGRAARFLFSHPVLGKYGARYFLDESCGYIFVENPTWLDEAYSSAISSTDTGCLERNLKNVEIVDAVLARNREKFRTGVDVGAGYGLFVRGMRDRGHQFFWSDKYAENLLARGFEARDAKYDVAVAFEVLEHADNPLGFLREARAKYQFDTCFFSATCFDENNIPDQDWWYWSFEGGQHISLFSRRTIEWIAGQLDMRLTFIAGDLFALSSGDWNLEIPAATIPQRAYRKLAPLFGAAARPRQQSLAFPDHVQLRELLRKAQMSNRH